jgi:hypothetical protein
MVAVDRVVVVTVVVATAEVATAAAVVASVVAERTARSSQRTECQSRPDLSQPYSTRRTDHQ